MKEIKVFESGTHAVTKLGDIEGIITGVCVRDGRVTYEFNYFNSGAYTTIWLGESEFEVKKEKKVKIGFKK